MARIVAVHSFRGGTGKSNITANLAALTARTGARVAIVDTDVQSPGIHVLFGLDETNLGHSLNDYLWGSCAIGDAAHDVRPTLPDGHGASQPAQGALYLIPASIREADITRVLRDGYDVELLTDGIRELIAGFGLDYVFLDTHPGLNEETLLSITISDVLILLLRPDHQDFQGTAVTVEVARKLGVPEMLLVVNKLLPSVDRAAIRQQVEAAYGVRVVGLLPLSEEMIALGSAELLCARYPDHEITGALESIVQSLRRGDSA